ncbi:MAG: LysM peptidoglycan-binding domain-containing protein [Planctomycetota bacterium]|nr:LysM peptidoglycan-binding domain-containing protein [Planctomycetota bacterium]
MSRETKVGLLVGLIFIGLFGLILSFRAGSEVVGHANLPVGESQKYRTMARALRHDVDPFIEHSVLDIAPAGPRQEGPAAREALEERLPAPGSIRETEPPARTVSEVGVIAAGPIEAVTPVRETPGEGPAEGGSPPAREAERAKEPAPAAPTYVVRANDSLVLIARRFYGTQGDRLWRRIYEANRSVLSDPDRLRAGQELAIPGMEASPAPATVPATESDGVRTVTADELAEMLGNRSDLVEAPSPLPATYTVRAGDTFYGIAERLYGNARYASLLHLKNKHLVPDATKLRAGQRIVLLEGVEAAAAGEQVAMR